MDDIAKSASEERRHREMLRDQRERDLMNQMESADQARKLNNRLDNIERQNHSIENDLDEIRTRRR